VRLEKEILSLGTSVYKVSSPTKPFCHLLFPCLIIPIIHKMTMLSIEIPNKDSVCDISSICSSTTSYYSISDVYDISNNILGEGSFGIVRLCMHRTKFTNNAVKSIDKSLTNSVRINQEIEILQSIDHPNILKLVDLFEDESHVHVVTELYTGGELYDYICRHISEDGCAPEDQAKSIIKAVLESVQYLHKKDIVHRDIKPENILFANDEFGSYEKGQLVKLVDFGQATIHRTNEAKMSEHVGTAYYTSPDILNGKYDRSCDIYSVGVITYCLLAGCAPFNGKNDHEIHEATRKGHLVFERVVWRKLSRLSRDFVRELICVGGQDGIVTATEALEHPWLKE